MKRLISYGLAGALLLATAMPALARSWDVCLDPAHDLNPSTEAVGGLPLFFAAVAKIYPAGTFKQATSASPLTTCTTDAKVVGTFFAMGGLVANLPDKGAKDVFYVQWHFRINNQGAFDTGGPVESGNPGDTYPQTITGATRGLAPAKGAATVKILAADGVENSTVNAFRVRVP